MDLTPEDLTDEAIAERFPEPEVAEMIRGYVDAARLEVIELAKANKRLPWVRVDGELRSYMVGDIGEGAKVVPMGGSKFYAGAGLPGPVPGPPPQGGTG